MRISYALCTLMLAAACATAPLDGDAIETANAPETSLSAAEADVAAITGCLDFQTEDDAACIGAVSRRCGEALGEGASTTAGMVMCADREARAWRTTLDMLAAHMRRGGSAGQLALLETALAEGERWTEARCAFAASLYESGSLARVLAAQCRRDTLANRAIDLHRRFDER